MAKYCTFVVVRCRTRTVELVTSSARKADTRLISGVRVEVWNGNEKINTFYNRDRRAGRSPLGPYIEEEREYIKQKQATAEARNGRRKNCK